MDNLAEEKYPEVLSDLAAKAAELLKAEGIEVKRARDLGWKIAGMVGREWAGQQVYIGKGVVVTERDMEIYRELRDGNYAYLAKKYGLTERQIYNIVARVRAWEFSRRQMGLFENP